ncbi:hypothetical protein KH5_14340 [Urechidicola sp. KH5]
MNVDFKQLPNASKIWIFPSSKKLHAKLFNEIQDLLTQFSSNWLNNGKPVISGYKIAYNRIIIVGVDQTIDSLNVQAIDALISFIIGIENKHDLTLLDKVNVCFKQGDFVQYKSVQEFKKMLKQGAISKKIIVFNNLIETKEELEDAWEVPITESWHNRFI